MNATAPTVPPPASLDREREWELVMRGAVEGLVQGTDLTALQADTARKIASAEHAYNRLLADCARLGISAAPVPETQPAPESAAAPRTVPDEAEKVAEIEPLAA
jgi:hypothetical protein